MYIMLGYIEKLKYLYLDLFSCSNWNNESHSSCDAFSELCLKLLNGIFGLFLQMLIYYLYIQYVFFKQVFPFHILLRNSQFIHPLRRLAGLAPTTRKTYYKGTTIYQMAIKRPSHSALINCVLHFKKCSKNTFIFKVDE